MSWLSALLLSYTFLSTEGSHLRKPRMRRSESSSVAYTDIPHLADIQSVAARDKPTRLAQVTQKPARRKDGYTDDVSVGGYSGSEDVNRCGSGGCQNGVEIQSSKKTESIQHPLASNVDSPDFTAADFDNSITFHSPRFDSGSVSFHKNNDATNDRNVGVNSYDINRVRRPNNMQALADKLNFLRAKSKSHLSPEYNTSQKVNSGLLSQFARQVIHATKSVEENRLRETIMATHLSDLPSKRDSTAGSSEKELRRDTRNDRMHSYVRSLKRDGLLTGIPEMKLLGIRKSQRRFQMNALKNRLLDSVPYIKGYRKDRFVSGTKDKGGNILNRDLGENAKDILNFKIISILRMKTSKNILELRKLVHRLKPSSDKTNPRHHQKRKRHEATLSVNTPFSQSNTRNKEETPSWLKELTTLENTLLVGKSNTHRLNSQTSTVIDRYDPPKERETEQRRFPFPGHKPQPNDRYFLPSLVTDPLVTLQTRLNRIPVRGRHLLRKRAVRFHHKIKNEHEPIPDSVDDTTFYPENKRKRKVPSKHVDKDKGSAKNAGGISRQTNEIRKPDVNKGNSSLRINKRFLSKRERNVLGEKHTKTNLKFTGGHSWRQNQKTSKSKNETSKPVYGKPNQLDEKDAQTAKLIQPTTKSERYREFPNSSRNISELNPPQRSKWQKSTRLAKNVLVEKQNSRKLPIPSRKLHAARGQGRKSGNSINRLINSHLTLSDARPDGNSGPRLIPLDHLGSIFNDSFLGMPTRLIWGQMKENIGHEILRNILDILNALIQEKGFISALNKLSMEIQKDIKGMSDISEKFLLDRKDKVTDSFRSDRANVLIKPGGGGMQDTDVSENSKNKSGRKNNKNIGEVYSSSNHKDTVMLSNGGDKTKAEKFDKSSIKTSHSNVTNSNEKNNTSLDISSDNNKSLNNQSKNNGNPTFATTVTITTTLADGNIRSETTVTTPNSDCANTDNPGRLCRKESNSINRNAPIDHFSFQELDIFSEVNLLHESELIEMGIEKPRTFQRGRKILTSKMSIFDETSDDLRKSSTNWLSTLRHANIDDATRPIRREKRSLRERCPEIDDLISANGTYMFYPEEDIQMTFEDNHINVYYVFLMPWQDVHMFSVKKVMAAIDIALRKVRLNIHELSQH